MTLRGRQMKSCNYTEIFYYLAHWGFSIVGGGVGGGGGGGAENALKSRKIKSIVPDLYEIIMACMLKNILFSKSYAPASLNWGHKVFCSVYLSAFLQKDLTLAITFEYWW